jgi:hypothetical protein
MKETTGPQQAKCPAPDRRPEVRARADALRGRFGIAHLVDLE